MLGSGSIPEATGCTARGEGTGSLRAAKASREATGKTSQRSTPRLTAVGGPAGGRAERRVGVGRKARGTSKRKQETDVAV